MPGFLRGFSAKSFGAALLVEAFGLLLWVAFCAWLDMLNSVGTVLEPTAILILGLAFGVGFEKRIEGLWHLFLKIDGYLAVFWLVLVLTIVTDYLFEPSCPGCSALPLLLWLVLPLGILFGLSVLMIAIEDTRLPQSKESE